MGKDLLKRNDNILELKGDMMQQSKSMFAKAMFFFIVGVVLASLFIWCLIQGITIHLSGDVSTPMMYYVALACRNRRAHALHSGKRAIPLCKDFKRIGF